jgi:hypothetical protein
MAYVIGIDPGAKGGVAIIPVYDFRGTVTHSLAKTELSDLADMLRDYREADTHIDIYLENPQLPPFNLNNKNQRFSVQAHNKLARSVGRLEGVIVAFGYVPTLLTPQKWQNALETRTKGDKKVTHALARRLFPFLERTGKQGQPISLVTHDVADALLIALYGYIHVSERKYWTKEVKGHVNPTKFPGKERKKLDEHLQQLRTLPDGLGLVRADSRRKVPPRSRKVPPRARFTK